MAVTGDENRNVLKPPDGVSAVVVAGGSGIRMKSPIRKQYLLLGNRPILSRTLDVFNACKPVERVFLVVPEEDFDFVEKSVLADCRTSKKIFLLPGGKFRQESVFNGVRAVPASDRYVVVHDGVRPLIETSDIERALDGARKTGACILGVAVRETLKRVGKDCFIHETPDRNNIWFAQTPQVFERNLLLKAHESAASEGFLGTDDASLVERLGENVLVIRGNPLNIKITTPEDLLLAECVLRSSERVT